MSSEVLSAENTKPHCSGKEVPESSDFSYDANSILQRKIKHQIIFQIWF